MTATPDTYRALLRELRPGDTLNLLPGEYRDGLPIHRLEGRERAPITIQGSSGNVVFLADPRRNTVSILDSSHVTVRGLRLDGRDLETDAVVCESQAKWAHHITLERLTIVGHGHDRFTVGIATRCPAWGWVIRDTRIIDAGTGMYLGNSDGTGPFIAGLIEGNEITNPIGYGIQIKHQVARPDIDGMPTPPAVTILRRNRFIKSLRASQGEDARPNLLLGHFPVSGRGAEDFYLVYRNLFFDNPTEALFQGEGNLALYNNLFINPRGDAIHVQPHNHLPRSVFIFSNTVLAAAVGISVKGGEPGREGYVGHNAVFAEKPVLAEVGGPNFTASLERAGAYVRRASGTPVDIDLTPKGNALDAPGSLPPSARRFVGAERDYRGRKGAAAVFGACAGSGSPSPCR